jgi:putative transposase
MGVFIQFESHRVELAASYEMEHDPLTLEFYDQPPSMMLDYNCANGRRMAVRHTPDFFVLRQDSAGWEDWKTEEDLHKLSEHNPNRYRQEAGSWHCPPGETYAAQFGLSYQVRSAKEIHWRLQRNILFIQDYLHTDPDRIPAATRERLIAYVTALGALSLADLIEQTAEFATPDDIYLLIAAGRLHVDLCAEPVAEPARIRVFPDRDAEIRCGSFPNYRTGGHALLPPFESFRAGAVLTWDDRIWKVVNVGSTRISLLGAEGSLVELSQDRVECLIREGRMASPRANIEGRQKLSEHLLHASEDDLREANHRADVVRRRLSGEPPTDGETISARTLRRWISRYRGAEAEWGAGCVGLLPRTGHRGNSTRRLAEESLRLMNEVIEREYETVRQKSRVACWAILKETCKQQAVPERHRVRVSLLTKLVE